MAQKRKDKAKKRVVLIEPVGQVHIRASFNNIIISVTNMTGQVISWASAGKMGFKGSKKNTPYAAQMAAEDCSKVALEAGLKKVKVYVKGPGNGRDQRLGFPVSPNGVLEQVSVNLNMYPARKILN